MPEPTVFDDLEEVVGKLGNLLEDKIPASLSRLEERIRFLQEQLTKCTFQYKTTSGEVARLQAQLDTELKEKTNCERELKERGIRIDKLEQLENQLKEGNAEFKGIIASLRSKLNEQKDTFQSESDERDGRIQDLEQQLKDAEKQQDTFKMLVDEYKERLTTAVAKLTQFETSANEIHARIDNAAVANGVNLSEPLPPVVSRKAKAIPVTQPGNDKLATSVAVFPVQ